MCYYPVDLDTVTSIVWTIEQCGFDSQQGQKFFFCLLQSVQTVSLAHLACYRKCNVRKVPEE
jgi:hypothetical protein